MRQGETPLLPVRGRWGCTPPLAPWLQLKRFHSALGYRFPLPHAGEGQGEGVAGQSAHQRRSLTLALSQREREKAQKCSSTGLSWAWCLPHHQATPSAGKRITPDSYALGALAETKVLTSSSPKARIVTSKRSCIRASFSPRSRVKQQYSSCMPLGSLK